MRGATAFVLVLVVLLGGCGGGPASDAGSSSSNASTPSRSSSRDGEVPSESTGDPVPEESERTDEDEDEDGDGDGEEERVLEVGGPTLDNTYPTNPFALPYLGGSSCVLFSNRVSDVTVTVQSVQLINLQPPGDPGLTLGTEPSEHPQCSSPPGEPTWTASATCVEAKLEPNASTACPVEVRSVGSAGTDYTARLVLRLSATCTDLVGEPCDRLVGRAEPTPTEPVTITWEVSRRYSSCLVPRDRDGSEFLPEESEGRCPLDTPTETPTDTPTVTPTETPPASEDTTEPTPAPTSDSPTGD